MGTSHSRHRLRPEVIEDLLIATEFTEHELRLWYKGFMKDCPTGYATLDDFKRIYRGFFPKGNSDRFAKFVFKRFDENKDEQIDYREFIVSLSTTFRGGFQDKMKWAFRMYDLDEDGYITREEMLEIMKSIYEMIDADDLVLPADERTPEQRTNKIFQAMDFDHDGRISEEEFVTAMTKDTKIIRLVRYEH